MREMRAPTINESADREIEEIRTHLEQAEGGREFWKGSYKEVYRRLVTIERKVLWRDESMPGDAVGWYKGKNGFPHFAIQFDTGMVEGVQTVGPVAPDYRPEEPGPLFLPILDAKPPEPT